MFCSECGAQQPNDNVKFCSECGAPIAPANGGAQPAPAPAQQTRTSQVPVGQPVAPAPVAQPSVPEGAIPAAAVQSPKRWYENTYVRIGLAIVGVILVVVGISRIVNGLSGNSGNLGESPAPSEQSSSSSTASASPSASSASTPPSASASAQQSQTAMQTIGDAKVGYLQVPATWVDRTSQDIDQRMIDSTAALYYVDPGTEFTSATLSHYAFAKSVTLTVQPADIETIANTYITKYSGDSAGYSDVDIDEGTVNGHDAVLITAFMPDDGVQVMTLVLDRDGDGTASVAIEANCGTTEASATKVLGYIRTWSY